eukprot:69474-Rhodomonas_salina.1
MAVPAQGQQALVLPQKLAQVHHGPTPSLPPSLPRSLTHSLAPSLPHSLAHSLTHSPPPSFPSLPLSLSP